MGTHSNFMSTVGSMKIVATIEARMTSSRLPGKVLLLAGGKPMLKHLIDRLRAVLSINDSADILVEFSRNEGDARLSGQ